MIPPEAHLLRLYLNANDLWKSKPLYQVVVEAARGLHLAGASVFNVELGYGAHQRLHDAESEYTSFEIPVVVEVIDAPEQVAVLLSELETLVGEGLVVVSAANVLHYSQGGAQPRVFHEILGSKPRSFDSPQGSPAQGTAPMKIEGAAQRLTVYIGSSDTWNGRNLAVAIVERCRELGMAGATVARGIMGFGKQSVIHRAHWLGLSEDLPEKVEVVDRADQIERLLPALESMIGGGLIVVEDVHVVRYLHDPKAL